MDINSTVIQWAYSTPGIYKIWFLHLRRASIAIMWGDLTEQCSPVCVYTSVQYLADAQKRKVHGWLRLWLLLVTAAYGLPAVSIPINEAIMVEHQEVIHENVSLETSPVPT